MKRLRACRINDWIPAFAGMTEGLGLLVSADHLIDFVEFTIF
jgi:hypothetical protein